jgi:hypothetical protein
MTTNEKLRFRMRRLHFSMSSLSWGAFTRATLLHGTLNVFCVFGSQLFPAIFKNVKKTKRLDT